MRSLEPRKAVYNEECDNIVDWRDKISFKVKRIACLHSRGKEIKEALGSIILSRWTNY
jgi:hypothetical protein